MSGFIWINFKKKKVHQRGGLIWWGKDAFVCCYKPKIGVGIIQNVFVQFLETISSYLIKKNFQNRFSLSKKFPQSQSHFKLQSQLIFVPIFFYFFRQKFLVRVSNFKEPPKKKPPPKEKTMVPEYGSGYEFVPDFDFW